MRRIVSGWLLVAGVALPVLLLSQGLGPWGRLGAMWAALWIGFKALTLLAEPPGRLRALSIARALGYVFLWHGTDPAPFLGAAATIPLNLRLVGNGARNIACGAAVLWIGPRAPWLRDVPLVQAWIGMVGLGLMLHLGLTDWVTAFWQRRGLNVERLFRFPLGATSASEFWGGRWNLAFTQLTRTHIFRPLVRRLGGTWGTMAGFLFSGLLHELVISFPAGSGFGLPTLYFALQGTCVVLERAGPMRAGLRRHRAVAWCWTCAVVALPLPILFHPPFLYSIVLPLMRLIGVVT